MDHGSLNLLFLVALHLPIPPSLPPSLSVPRRASLHRGRLTELARYSRERGADARAERRLRRAGEVPWTLNSEPWILDPEPEMLSPRRLLAPEKQVQGCLVQKKSSTSLGPP